MRLLRRCSPQSTGLAVLMVVLAFAGCGGQARSEPQTPSRTTPAPGSTRPSPQALRAALLTVEEVQALPTAAAGLLEELGDAYLGKQPSAAALREPPRGPCGGKIAAPAATDAALRRFTDPSGSSVARLVFALPPGRAERYMAEVRADARPHCPASRSRTPDGFQTVRFLEEVPLPPIGDDRLATVVRIGDGGTDDAYLLTARVRAGANLTAVIVTALPPLPRQFLIDLAVAAAKKLP